MIEVLPKWTILYINELNRKNAKYAQQIANEKADLYVLSIGSNDICYRDTAQCAMDSKQYIVNIDLLVKSLRQVVPGTRIAIISPWRSFDPDPFCPVTKEAKQILYEEYATALEQYCLEHECLYINPNNFIQESVQNDHMNRAKYFKDHIHPNADQGIQLFSKACVVASTF